jgi:hypothetical protein
VRANCLSRLVTPSFLDRFKYRKVNWYVPRGWIFEDKWCRTSRNNLLQWSKQNFEYWHARGFDNSEMKREVCIKGDFPLAPLHRVRKSLQVASQLRAVLVASAVYRYAHEHRLEDFTRVDDIVDSGTGPKEEDKDSVGVRFISRVGDGGANSLPNVDKPTSGERSNGVSDN